jgi:IS5 family transposase
MHRGTLAEEGFERYRKPTRRKQFLEEMDRIIPGTELSAVIEPFYPKTKKGNLWGFGMKAPIGVDGRTKLIHSVAATAANVHDSRVLPDLLHGGETRFWGDAAYGGQGEVIRRQAQRAKDFTQKKGHCDHDLTKAERAKNRNTSRVRAKVEHPFLVLKRLFGFTKVRYRGLAKNAHWLFVACGLVNLYMARRPLLRPRRGRVPEICREARLWESLVKYRPLGH